MTNQTKIFKNYTERFKRQVVIEVLSGQLSKAAVSRKYGIKGKSTVHKWCLKYGGERYRKGLYIDLPLEYQSRDELMKEKKTEQLPDDVKLLKERIVQLETQLEAETLKREAFERFVAIAKRDYGVDLTKKSDTKQSPK